MERLEQNCQSSFSTLRGEVTSDSKPDLTYRYIGGCLHNFQYWKIEISLIKIQVSASLSDRESPGNVGPALLPSNSWNRATVPRKMEHTLSTCSGQSLEACSLSPESFEFEIPLERKNHIEMIRYMSLSHLQPTRGRESHIPLYIPSVKSWT